MTPTETWKFISKVDSAANCSRQLVFKWHSRFRSGDDSVLDKNRTGRPKVAQSNHVERVTACLQEDRRRTVREISDILGLKRTMVHEIMTDELNMSKVCARWVPRLLKTEEMAERVDASSEFLRLNGTEGISFLPNIITTDETWLHLYEPESKRDSMIWKTPKSPAPVKAKQNKSAKKFMFIFFMDSEGMLLQHAVPSNQTANALYYKKVIRRDLIHAIRKKRPDMDIEKMYFHQDNAPAHRCEETLLTIDFLGFRRLRHAPYSPDLAPMDFAVFPRLKSELRGKRFSDLAELRMGVRSVVSGFDRIGTETFTGNGSADIGNAWHHMDVILRKSENRRSFDVYDVKVLRDCLYMLYVKTVLMLIFITVK